MILPMIELKKIRMEIQLNHLLEVAVEQIVEELMLLQKLSVLIEVKVLMVLELVLIVDQ